MGIDLKRETLFPSCFFLGSEKEMCKRFCCPTTVAVTEFADAIVFCMTFFFFMDFYLWGLCSGLSAKAVAVALCGKRRQQLWQCQPAGQVII